MISSFSVFAVANSYKLIVWMCVSTKNRIAIKLKIIHWIPNNIRLIPSRLFASGGKNHSKKDNVIINTGERTREKRLNTTVRATK